MKVRSGEAGGEEGGRRMLAEVGERGKQRYARRKGEGGEGSGGKRGEGSGE